MVDPSRPVAVVAPCGIYDPSRLAAGLAIASAAGLELELLPDLLRPHRYLASPDDQRATQLLQALTDDRFGAVWIARGGYGLTRVLDRLDGVELPHKPVIGFSDVTALFAALHPRGLGPLVHAPVVHSLPITDAESLGHLWDHLAGRPTPPLVGHELAPGVAAGPLIGGNLCLLAALCGTPWQLDVRGAILVLEEIGEPPYRVDRMLQQLVSAGALDGVAAVAIGELTGCNVPEGADWTLEDVLMDHLAPLGVPVVGGLPIGHGTRNHAFTWGAPARLADGRLAWS